MCPVSLKNIKKKKDTHKYIKKKKIIYDNEAHVKIVKVIEWLIHSFIYYITKMISIVNVETLNCENVMNVCMHIFQACLFIFNFIEYLIKLLILK